MGHPQHTLDTLVPARHRRLGCRTCLRRGCGRSFQPRRWNQRYCHDPECLRLLRRWQAAKRQQERRRRPEARKAHADAERARRARRRAEGRDSPPAASPHEHGVGDFGESCCPASVAGSNVPEHDGEASHEPPADRDHDNDPPAAVTRATPKPDGSHLNGGAWSRSKSIPFPFCDRPGCYAAVRPSCRCRARYCGDECRQAVQRVLDRERKWLYRNTNTGRLKRQLEYEAARRASRVRGPTG